MTYIIKRSGKKQKFVRTKLENAVKKAAREARISASKVKEIIKDVVYPVAKKILKRKLIKAVQLRKVVLDRLESRSKAVVAAWRRHDKKKRR